MPAVLDDGTTVRGGRDFLVGDFDNPAVRRVLDRRLRQTYSAEEFRKLQRRRDDLERERLRAYDTYPAFMPNKPPVCGKRIGGCGGDLAPLDDTCPACGTVRPEGPQEIAFRSLADILFVGGAASGGKTGFMCGKTLMHGLRVLWVRQNANDLDALMRKDFLNFTNDIRGRNMQARTWEFTTVPLYMEWTGLTTDTDVQAVQGNPWDLICVDEGEQLLKALVEFIMNWNRTTEFDVHCQTMIGSNPPGGRNGVWLFDDFRPWIPRGRDPYTGEPLEPDAAYGELRYFARDPKNPKGPMRQVPKDYRETITLPNGNTIEVDPVSRTHVGFFVDDNPYFDRKYWSRLAAGKAADVQRLLHGAWDINLSDQDDQIIPMAWIKDAQDRWIANWNKMDGVTESAIGCDPGRTTDPAVIAARFGQWFSPLTVLGGDGAVIEGSPLASRIMEVRTDPDTPIYLDDAGIGSSCYDVLGEKYTGKANKPFQGRDHGLACGVQAGNRPWARRASDGRRFVNVRAMLWYCFRELLDPVNGFNIMLPPDDQLLFELSTPLYWTNNSRKIQVESKKEIRQRTGKQSTDRADAVLYAAIGLSVPHHWLLRESLDERNFTETGERAAVLPPAEDGEQPKYGIGHNRPPPQDNMSAPVSWEGF